MRVQAKFFAQLFFKKAGGFLRQSLKSLTLSVKTIEESTLSEIKNTKTQTAPLVKIINNTYLKNLSQLGQNTLSGAAVTTGQSMQAGAK